MRISVSVIVSLALLAGLVGCSNIPEQSEKPLPSNSTLAARTPESSAPQPSDRSSTMQTAVQSEVPDSDLGELLQVLPDGKTTMFLQTPGGTTMLEALEPAQIVIQRDNGERHVLWSEQAYETRFIDIKLSEDHTTLAVWTHIVPDASSWLWTVGIEPRTWSSGETVQREVATAETGQIAFDLKERLVTLSNGQQFPMPD